VADRKKGRVRSSSVKPKFLAEKNGKKEGKRTSGFS